MALTPRAKRPLAAILRTRPGKKSSETHVIIRNCALGCERNLASSCSRSCTKNAAWLAAVPPARLAFVRLERRPRLPAMRFFGRRPSTVSATACALARCAQGLRKLSACGQPRQQPVGKLAPPAFANVQAKLAASPQHVFGRQRPFIVDEMGNLALIQARTEMDAEPRAVL